MSIRTDRVGGEIKKALAETLSNDLSDLSDALITITQVRMSPDLRSGKVYVSVLGGSVGSDQVLHRLKTAAPQLRAAVSRLVRLKFTPELTYYLDDTESEAQKIEVLLKQIRDERAQREARDTSNPGTIEE